MDIRVFAIIGGDERSALLASALVDSGCRVFAAGFEKRGEAVRGAVMTDAAAAAAMAEAVVFPVIPVAGDGTIFAPLSECGLALDRGICGELHGKPLFTGGAASFRRVWQESCEPDIYDYGADEAFLIGNARLTAESALMLAAQLHPSSLYGSRCVVTGFGRIGKALAPMLRGMGADVAVFARSGRDIALAETLGLDARRYDALPEEAEGADILINTADAPVVTEEAISRMSADALIIDLASKPGGVDFSAAESRGVRAIHALGLPGKYSPRAAADIIRKTIFTMLGEEKL